MLQFADVVFYKPRTSDIKLMVTVINENLESVTVAMEFPYETKGIFKEVLERRILDELNAKTTKKVVKVIIK